MRQRVPLFGPETKDRSPDVSAVERLNMYLGPNPGGARGDMVLYSMPGTRDWLSLGGLPVKAWRVVGDYLYAVTGSQIVRVANDGTTTVRATLPSSSSTFDASDNGEQIIFVAGAAAWIFTIATDVVAAVSGFPGGETVAYQGGRFLSESGNKIFASDYGAGQTWGGLTFASAEAYSDNVSRLFVYDNVVIAFGERSVEFWQNVGTSPFPYAPVGTAPQSGLAARWSVAGGSDGVFALLRDASGRLAVCKIAQYAVASVTDNRQSAIFEDMTTVSDARGFVFEAAGHEFYQITFPTSDQTWIYDDETGVWSRGVTIDGAQLDGYRAITFGGRRLIASGVNGALAEVDLDVPTWAATSTPKGFISRHVSLDYRPAICPSVELECEAGTGVSGGGDPQVMMQVSRDGGHTWGPERWRGLGAIGNRRQRQVWWRNGTAREWTFKFRVSDAASRVVIMSALAEFQVAA